MKKRISSTIPPCSKKKERLVRIKFHMSFIVGGIIEEIQKRVPPLITFFSQVFWRGGRNKNASANKMFSCFMKKKTYFKSKFREKMLEISIFFYILYRT